MTKLCVLCVDSGRQDVVKDHLREHYRVSLVSDPKVAVRKAQLGVFDVYVAISREHYRRALFVWSELRKVDCNTPFVFICRSPSDRRTLAQRLRKDYDDMVYPQSPADVVPAIDRLFAVAEQRSWRASDLTTRAVQREVSERLRRLQQTTNLSRRMLVCSQEQVVRARAFGEYNRCGGTRAYFDRWWPDAFLEATALDGSVTH